MLVSDALTGTGFWAKLVLTVLATWRLTHLLASEDGPADLIVRFRALLGRSIAGKLMDCFNCLSLWIAAPAALFISRRPLEWIFCWLGISGGACLLERIGQQTAVIKPIPQETEGEINDVLRTQTFGVEEHLHNDATEDHPIRPRH